MTDYGPIQIQPPGLLGVLQLKNSGQNPSRLSDTYNPVLEMRDWLLLARAEALLEGFPAIAAAGATFTPSTGVFIVPNKEHWFIHRIQCALLSSAAADVISMAHVAMQLPVGAVQAIIGLTPPSYAPPVGGAILSATYSNGGGFFVPAGAILGITYNKNAAAPAIGSLSALITRCPI